MSDCSAVVGVVLLLVGDCIFLALTALHNRYRVQFALDGRLRCMRFFAGRQSGVFHCCLQLCKGLFAQVMFEGKSFGSFYSEYALSFAGMIHAFDGGCLRLAGGFLLECFWGVGSVTSPVLIARCQPSNSTSLGTFFFRSRVARVACFF